MPYKQICKKTRYAEAKFNWPEEVALSWYKQNGDKMALNFPCKSGAVNIINTLYNNGHEIIIATARANDWHADPKGLTLKWLNDNKIKYHKLYLGRIDKEKVCEEEKADFFIDDDIKIAEKVASHLGGQIKKTFLMTTNYNEDLAINENVIRVKDFSDFAKKLKAFGVSFGNISLEK